LELHETVTGRNTKDSNNKCGVWPIVMGQKVITGQSGRDIEQPDPKRPSRADDGTRVSAEAFRRVACSARDLPILEQASQRLAAGKCLASRAAVSMSANFRESSRGDIFRKRLV
jgi:hypothetical protein